MHERGEVLDGTRQRRAQHADHIEEVVEFASKKCGAQQQAAASAHLDLSPCGRASLGGGVLHGEAFVNDHKVPRGLAHKRRLRDAVQCRDDDGVAVDGRTSVAVRQREECAVRALLDDVEAPAVLCQLEQPFP